jgi:hypothetical protein
MAAAEIQFATGAFQSFRAVAKIHLGKIATDVREGDIIQFDGQTIKLGGVDHPYPELRAGIRVGWFVPEKDNISNYRPKPAEANVRSAVESKTKERKQAMATVTDDEKDMGPARGRHVIKADDPDEAKEVATFSKSVKNQDDLERPVGPALRKAASEMKTDSVGNEDARQVGKVRTPAVMKTVVSDGGQAAREAARLDNAPPPRAILSTPTGVIHAAEAEEVGSIIEVLNPEDQARIVREQRKAQAEAAAKAAKAAPSAEPAVKQIPATADLMLHSGTREQQVALARQILAEEDARIAAALEAAAVPAKATVKAPVSHKKKTPVTIEQIIVEGDDIDLGNGVKWDKTLHWRTRAKIAAEQYGTNQAVLEAIRAVEAPAVVALIKERLTALNPGT